MNASVNASTPSLYPYFIDGRPLLEVAYAMSLAAHAHMRRKVDGNPFINHPVRVAAALWRCGLDDTVIAAGFLHDIVEDTPTTIEEVRSCVGEDVATLVAALTEVKDIPDYEQRKAEHLQRLASSGARALAIFCADKLVNLQDLLQDYEVEGENMGLHFNGSLDQKEAHTREQIKLLLAVDGASSLPLLGELIDLNAAFRRARQANTSPRVLADPVFAP